MSFMHIMAIFPSPEATQQALEGLRDLGLNQRAVRVDPHCALQLEIGSTLANWVVGRLRDSGALDVVCVEKAEPGWMSHHSGQVTGTGVEPGAGDSEAGLSSSDPSVR
jgi:hypothetical protein